VLISLKDFVEDRVLGTGIVEDEATTVNTNATFKNYVTYMAKAIISKIDVTWLIFKTLCCKIFSVNS
jgi:hypothetical protein